MPRPRDLKAAMLSVDMERIHIAKLKEELAAKIAAGTATAEEIQKLELMIAYAKRREERLKEEGLLPSNDRGPIEPPGS